MIQTLLQFAGSLCFLLYGMKLMSDGIQKSAGEKLQAALHFMIGNRFKGFLTGCLLTMIIQSSGATTVMVVTFVNAGLISLEQSIGVIFGANIGTTITAWIVALFGFSFKIETFAVPVFGVGFLLYIVRKWHAQGWGESIMGFGILFIALAWLSKTFTIDNSTLSFLPALQNWGVWSILLAFTIGLVFTALIHSSSAMTAIVITMAYNKLLTWEFSAAIVIGSNIGSTIDSIMATFGAKVNAKRTALVHVLFNCTTAIIALIFIKPFTQFVDFITPGTIDQNITYHIAMLHTCFNVAGTLLFIPWTKQIAHLTELIVKSDANELPQTYTLTFPEKVAQESPVSCSITGQNEVSRMADIVVQMFDRLQYGFTDGGSRFIADHYEPLVAEENYLDQMHEQLTKYFVRCEQFDIDDRMQNNVSVMIQITSEIESMSDDCMSMGMYIKKMNDKQLTFPREEFEKLLPYLELARELLYFIYKNINTKLTQDQLDFAHEIEN